MNKQDSITVNCPRCFFEFSTAKPKEPDPQASSTPLTADGDGDGGIVKLGERLCLAFEPRDRGIVLDLTRAIGAKLKQIQEEQFKQQDKILEYGDIIGAVRKETSEHGEYIAALPSVFEDRIQPLEHKVEAVRKNHQEQIDKLGLEIEGSAAAFRRESGSDLDSAIKALERKVKGCVKDDPDMLKQVREWRKEIERKVKELEKRLKCKGVVELLRAEQHFVPQHKPASPEPDRRVARDTMKKEDTENLTRILDLHNKSLGAITESITGFSGRLASFAESTSGSISGITEIVGDINRRLQRLEGRGK